ncbi:MAG: ATP-binding protein [Prevotellaceae bacterium]|jgi:hypothetical protein|nr:ATP-binding protein [Prevotellaceae bacterium]
MNKYFGTAGPIQPAVHYVVDPLIHLNQTAIEQLISQRKYLLFNAPPQTGKTSCMLALCDHLNRQGQYEALYMDVAVTPDYLSQLLAYMPVRPLVLVLDEIDVLDNDALLDLLRPLHVHFGRRFSASLQTVILCGVRDRRDLIKATSFRLNCFSFEEIHQLYMQHTEATGQQFDETCFPLIWKATGGHPWLVNALGNELTHNMVANRDRSVRIIPEMVYRAQENIIGSGAPHIRTLANKLFEEQVLRVIAPMLAGKEENEQMALQGDDVQYVTSLGLITSDVPHRVANTIYREMISREYARVILNNLTNQPPSYTSSDGTINVQQLLLDFQCFFRQNVGVWIEKFDHKEVAPQLLLEAYMQAAVDGCCIEHEYGLGRGRITLFIRKPLTDDYDAPLQQIVVDLKVKRSSVPKTITLGLEQVTSYMERFAPEAEGHFILCNLDPNATWSKKIWHYTKEHKGRKIVVWGL